MTLGTIMFYGGIALFAAALIGIIFTNIILSVKSRKLKRLLDDEYGL